jgi:acyl-coenzyme A synthetase/AMP-(fatty) acid ligase
MMAMRLGISSDDICYSEAKLFFAYGLGNNMTFPLWAGATAVLNGDRRPGDELPDHRAVTTHALFWCTHYLRHLSARLRQATAKPLFGSPARLGGRGLPAEILRRWREETGLSILDGIGSTEALHIFISNTPNDIRPGSSGKPVPAFGQNTRGLREPPLTRYEQDRVLRVLQDRGCDLAKI